jgi:putative acetyltransferase
MELRGGFDGWWSRPSLQRRFWIVGATSVTIREMRPDDARRFLEIHHAAKDYPTAVVEAWAQPITGRVIERFVANPDREVRVVAEIDGEPVGIGAIVVSNSELRACYVAPSAARRGVGSLLLRKSNKSPRSTISTT